MFTNKKCVLICDMQRGESDADTGDRTWTVANVNKIIGTVELVGVQTQQLAQIQNMTFQYSIVVDRMFYNEQKFLYMENHLYEIKAITKGAQPKDCKLNVVVCKDDDLITAIEGWINNANSAS